MQKIVCIVGIARLIIFQWRVADDGRSRDGRRIARIDRVGFTDARQSDTAIDYAIASLLSERLSLGRNTEPVGDIRAPDCVSDRDRGHGAIAIRKYRRTLPRVSRGLLDDLKRQIGQWHNMGVGIFGSASR
jgi:hypothetical protein